MTEGFNAEADDAPNYHWVPRGYQMKQSEVFATFLSCNIVGRDSSVGVATRYGLDGPGIEFRSERDFPHLSRPALLPT